MIKILPTEAELTTSAGSRVTATSDIDRLSHHWEFHVEAGALAGLALHTDLAGVFLDDAVGDREPEAGATAATLRRTILGGEEWIVNAMNMFGRDARASVAD